MNRKPWYRFRPHPASAVVWVYALLLLHYAAPRTPFSPKPGTIIVAHLPRMLHNGEALLAAYWLCAAAVLGWQAYRLPFEEPLRDAELWLAALVSTTAAAYGVACLVPGLGDSRTGWVLLLGILAGASAFFTAAYHVSRRSRRSGLVALALSLLVVFPLGLPELPVFSGAWQDLAQVKSADGRMYHVQLKEQGQGRDYVLTEETGRSLFFLRTRVLGDAIGITSFWPTLVRPAGARLRWANRQLVLSPDGRWLAYVTASYSQEGSYDICFAFNLRSRRFYARADRAQLSPFLLIGPNDTLNPGDVEALRSWMAHPYTPDEALAPEVLERDSHHPNPRVRALVEELRAGPHPAATESPRHD